MRIYADQLQSSLVSRKHKVEQLTAPALLGRLIPRRYWLGKWLGYIDQFILFPPLLWLKVQSLREGSLCVLMDQALGPWYPWLAGRPHVVHCHDFLALQASQGKQPFHKLKYSGRAYQRWIHRGFKNARCFISISVATKLDLEQQLSRPPLMSEVLYNPLPLRFKQIPVSQALAEINNKIPELSGEPFLFHIGRNWYKNRLGVLAIWEQLLLLGVTYHLVLGGSPDLEMQRWLRGHPHLTGLLHVLEMPSDDLVVALYNASSALLFPSHAEGFGWPVLEAMACGCPVLTTDLAPMTEVGGGAVATIPPAPAPPESLDSWAAAAAKELKMLIEQPVDEKIRARQLGLAQAQHFSLVQWEDKLEQYYKQALELQK